MSRVQQYTPKACTLQGTTATYAEDGGDHDTATHDVSITEITRKPVAPFTIWKPSDFMNHRKPEGHDIVGEGLIQMKEMTAIIGVGGCGKSRLTTWMAMCQITGRRWCDIETYGQALNWLFIGNENSIVRYKDDLECMFRNFTKDDQDKIERHLFLPANLNMDDRFMSLGDAEVMAKLSATVASVKPGVVVFDPFEAFMDGDLVRPRPLPHPIDSRSRP